MKNTTLFLAILFSVTFAFSQNITLQELGDIAGFAEETSGIEMADGLFWTHNDSGGANEIYGFNSSGTLVRTITVSNATNVDWEELAQDENGNLYIGDFGNNNNDRSAANGTPLRIYIIPNPMDIVGNSVTANIIEFEYVDRDFSLTGGAHDFNMEAMFWWNDTLHLFNKIGGDSPSTTVKHYVLPAAPGTYIAPIVETINICGAAACANSRKRVTAADISPCGRYVILITRARMYLFNCFSGSQYFTTGNMREFTYTNTQKEAVVFDTYQDIYITDEKSGGSGGKLYYFSLAPHVFPALELTADVVNSCGASGSIAANTTGGAPALSYSWDSGQNTSSISNLTNGSYSLTVTDGEGCSIDSTFTVVEAVFNETDEQTICSGTTYTFGAQTLSASGEFTETFSSVGSCDSIVTLTLSVVETFTGTDAQSICSGTTYTFGEQILTTSGEFTETFSSVEDCDSIVTLTLSLIEVDNSTVLVDQQSIQANAVGATYQWIDCSSGNDIPGANDALFTASQNGSYAVNVTINGCSETSDCVDITTLSLVENSSPNGIALFPNPATDVLTILYESNEMILLEFFDQTGKVVHSINFQGNEIVVDVSHLAKGMYTLQANGEVIQRLKFVKQ